MGVGAETVLSMVGLVDRWNGVLLRVSLDEGFIYITIT